ncbi:MAG: Folate-binding protein YgfZ [Candidatus Tokpelaia sp. JSC161]|jgi:hypothetical protein|nr:MAG: Folate-binding protein YgfZ [Candidatus Tokpelaia sp. JSC161]
MILDDRELIIVDGIDAAYFLQRLITTDIHKIGEHEMCPGALLSHQGKILFDFLIGRDKNVFFIDISRIFADAMFRKLTFYKLGSNIKISRKELPFILLVLKNSLFKIDSSILFFYDKRIFNSNIVRIYNFRDYTKSFLLERDRWNIIRIINGIAEIGLDFMSGSVFPHDINYDQIGGISFTKGCYIGQEVVSRMEHRSIIVRRLLVVRGEKVLPSSNAIIEVNNKFVGVLGTVIGHQAIALVRIDRIKMAISVNDPITVKGIKIFFSLPVNVNFTL